MKTVAKEKVRLSTRKSKVMKKPRTKVHNSKQRIESEKGKSSGITPHLTKPSKQTLEPSFSNS